MQGKTVLITGATNGIGLETARDLAKRGATLVLAGRNADKAERVRSEIVAESGNEAVTLLIADLSLQTGVRSLAEQFLAKHDALHVLINNAGALFSTRELTSEGHELTFALNHLNYFLLTELLRDVLVRSAPSRVVSVSSGAHMDGHIHFDDLSLEANYGATGSTAYCQSKLANVLHTRELARRLQGTGVTANSMHPGFVATGFARNNGLFARMFMSVLSLGARNVQHGAETVIWLATDPSLETETGGYFKDKERVTPSAEAQDDDVAARLWTLSEQLVDRSPQPS